MGFWGHVRHVTGPEPNRRPGTGARLVATARQHAGFTQSELARRTGVARPTINRIERARMAPRIEVMMALLEGCGVTLTTEPRRGADIDRGPIRTVLATETPHRLSSRQRRAVRLLASHAVRFVVVGDAAARLNGAPIPVQRVEVLVPPADPNLGRLGVALRRRWVLRHLDVRVGDDARIRRAAWLFDTLERPLLPREIRVAAIDDLIRTASPERIPLLHAVREELDALKAGSA